MSSFVCDETRNGVFSLRYWHSIKKITIQRTKPPNFIRKSQTINIDNNYNDNFRDIISIFRFPEKRLLNTRSEDIILNKSSSSLRLDVTFRRSLQFSFSRIFAVLDGLFFLGIVGDNSILKYQHLNCEFHVIR